MHELLILVYILLHVTGRIRFRIGWKKYRIRRAKNQRIRILILVLDTESRFHFILCPPHHYSWNWICSEWLIIYAEHFGHLFKIVWRSRLLLHCIATHCKNWHNFSDIKFIMCQGLFASRPGLDTMRSKRRLQTSILSLYIILFILFEEIVLADYIQLF